MAAVECTSAFVHDMPTSVRLDVPVKRLYMFTTIAATNQWSGDLEPVKRGQHSAMGEFRRHQRPIKPIQL